MSGKRWGECGTTQRWSKRKAFMSKTLMADEMDDSEAKRLRESRRMRGICEKCGRALHVSGIGPREVQLLCSCGFRTTAVRGSRAYRAAVALMESIKC